MGCGHAPSASAGVERVQALRGPAGSPESHQVHGALRLRMADAARPFPPMADGLLVVPPLHAAAHDHDVALMVDRDRAGRGPEPSAAILDRCRNGQATPTGEVGRLFPG